MRRRELIGRKPIRHEKRGKTGWIMIRGRTIIEVGKGY